MSRLLELFIANVANARYIQFHEALASATIIATTQSIPAGLLNLCLISQLKYQARACSSPIGAVLSISCSTAMRPDEKLSFAEELPLSGLCGAALGVVGRTLHAHNKQLGLALARALLVEGVNTVGDLVLAANAGRRALNQYRILGDPLAPIIGATDTAVRAATVFAPAPTDSLPVIPLSSWDTDQFPFTKATSLP